MNPKTQRLTGVLFSSAFLCGFADSPRMWRHVAQGKRHYGRTADVLEAGIEGV
jgi:hypothetical protein